LGLGLGAEFDLMAYLVSRYLGLRSYGQLYGYLYAAFGLGAGTGPVLMGWLFDELGNYTLGLALLSVLGFILAILASRLGPYREFNIAGQ
jgi:cyanate permease